MLIKKIKKIMGWKEQTESTKPDSKPRFLFVCVCIFSLKNASV